MQIHVEETQPLRIFVCVTLIPSTMKGGAEQKGLYIQIMLGVNSNRRTALRGLLAICR